MSKTNQPTRSPYILRKRKRGGKTTAEDGLNLRHNHGRAQRIKTNARGMKGKQWVENIRKQEGEARTRAHVCRSFLQRPTMPVETPMSPQRSLNKENEEINLNFNSNPCFTFKKQPKNKPK